MGTQQFLIHIMVTLVINMLSAFLFCLKTCDGGLRPSTLTA